MSHFSKLYVHLYQVHSDKEIMIGKITIPRNRLLKSIDNWFLLLQGEEQVPSLAKVNVSVLLQPDCVKIRLNHASNLSSNDACKPIAVLYLLPDFSSLQTSSTFASSSPMINQSFTLFFTNDSKDPQIHVSFWDKNYLDSDPVKASLGYLSLKCSQLQKMDSLTNLEFSLIPFDSGRIFCFLND